MRSFVSTLGNDLGVWCSKRHRCWTSISVHLYHRQFITGIHHLGLSSRKTTAVITLHPTFQPYINNCQAACHCQFR